MILTPKQAASGFAAIGSEPRIQVLLTLVRSGGDGLLFGDIQQRTGIPASTLSHHLRSLADAGLIVQTRQGRQTLTQPALERLEELSRFLLEQCCADLMDIAS